MKFHNGIVTLCILGGAIKNSYSFVTNPSAAYYTNRSNGNNDVSILLQQQQLQQQQQSTVTRNKNIHMTASASSSSSDSAKAFTDYLAKSHEEKLKALKEIENKKNSEIQALQDEMKALKASSGGIVQSSVQVSPPIPIVEGSIEDLSTKLLAYQTFMSKYIVNAQQDKYNAVKAAEAATAKKYEDKLNAFMLPGSASTSTSEESKLFQGRNANVAAAAQAGKSRWGAKEVQKAAGGSVAAVLEESSLYKERNDNVAAAAKAGKSRWGAKEILKVSGIVVVDQPTLSQASNVAQTSTATSPVSMDTITAADHGLRADGGVGGLTLEERVTAGAAAAITPSNGIAAAPGTQSSYFYAVRNANIAKAAAAGKQSRWGSEEEKKAVEEATNSLPPASATAQVINLTPEIYAADHGLRADGGVGGPSLAERVNLGAMLLQ